MTMANSLTGELGGTAADPVAQVCDKLLASLPRRDQRRCGADYVRGLLAARGRKSIRNIAGALGRPATYQRLHHFISDSTWDWRAVRRDLADRITRTAPPRAWVVRCVVLPKAGDRAVGVTRRYHAQLDRTVNAQVAAGLWAATSEYCIPANWRLYLPGCADEPAQGRIGGESLEECAVRAFTEMMPDLPPAPVLIDTRQNRLDPAVLIDRLHAAKVPAIVRIDPGLDLVSDDPADAGQPRCPRQAAAILKTSRCLPSPAVGADGTPCAVTATEVRCVPRAGTPRAGTPVAAPSRRLRLVGITYPGDPRPSSVWLTSMQASRRRERRELAWLTGLVEALERDMVNVARDVGVHDFIGRSYGGWHRHMTLASIAHAIRSETRATHRAPGHSPATLRAVA
jgi:DDE superfamily endonuclease